MKEPWIEVIRRWLRFPIPRRHETELATWWEWGGRMRRVTRKEARS